MTRVLIADDNPDILQALRLLLAELGGEVVAVTSVEAVIDHLRRLPFDLLLMDLNYSRDTTSGREGLELLAEVRRHDPGLPVVVMTGWGTIDTAVEAMRRGAKSFVQKPWDDAVLLEIVRREAAEGAALRQRDARIAREYEDARTIQRALLPAAMPLVAGCELAARWQPASGVGGDCYDVHRFGHTDIGVSIADVAGKGLPAALLMSNLQAAVRAFATGTATPGEVTASVNRLLTRNIAPGKFVTFCYAIVDLAAGRLTYANAGHNPPVLLRPGGAVEWLGATGVVLGVFADATYEVRHTRLDAGDLVMWYTDGITEATNGCGEEFGEARLVAALRDAGPRASDAVDAVAAAVALWSGGAPQDDATMIALRAG